MRCRPLFRLALLLLLILSSCGDLPEPFLGNPGAAARRLAVPVTPAMLAVPPPSGALLNGTAQTDFADLLALSLQKEEVPSLARAPHKGDWRLAVTAKQVGDGVVARYAIQDPSGKELGAIDGASFPVAGWTAGSPLVLGPAAKDAIPKVVALMLSIRNTRDRANPDSLLNRPARLFVPEVTGAPGDGNVALTRLIRARLAEFGPLVQLTPEGVDFNVTGKVTVVPIPGNQQRVEIVWTVTRPSGVVNGKVSQLNAVPAGTLDQYWGDIAAVVAQEASGGIYEVVQRFIGRDNPEGIAAPAVAAAVPQSAPAVPQLAPAVPQSAPAVPQSAAAVPQSAPAVPQSAAAQTPKPAASQSPPESQPAQRAPAVAAKTNAPPKAVAKKITAKTKAKTKAKAN